MTWRDVRLPPCLHAHVMRGIVFCAFFTCDLSAVAPASLLPLFLFFCVLLYILAVPLVSSTICVCALDRGDMMAMAPVPHWQPHLIFVHFLFAIVWHFFRSFENPIHRFVFVPLSLWQLLCDNQHNYRWEYPLDDTIRRGDVIWKFADAWCHTHYSILQGPFALCFPHPPPLFQFSISFSITMSCAFPPLNKPCDSAGLAIWDRCQSGKEL